MEEVLRAVAPGKINLTLEVLGKRDDGYHEIASVLQTIDLADELHLALADAPAVAIRDDQGRPVSVLSEQEIVERAWALLRQRHAAGDDARVDVIKRIPIAAGLGGGSADAAAFLRLAARRWDLPFSAEDRLDVAAALGSDVPACLIGGTLRLAGRGERVEALADAPVDPPWALLLFTPEIPVPAAKTAAMFSALRPKHYGDGAATRALAERLRAGHAPRPDDCANGFDVVADELLTGLRPARRRMTQALVRAGSEATPLLAGAGPTLFALDAPQRLQPAAHALRGQGGGRVVLARPLPRAAATLVEPLHRVPFER